MKHCPRRFKSRPTGVWMFWWWCPGKAITAWWTSLGINRFAALKPAAGRVHFYNEGMLHAKVMLMDDRLAVIGSANMDMRSLKLNYEVVMASYSRSEIQAVETWVNNLNAVPRPHPEPINTIRDFGEGLVKMLIPLL